MVDYILRDAHKEEARELAVLINHAGTGPNNNGIDIVGWTLDAEEGENPFDYGGRIIAAEDGNYSYNNMRVIACGGKIAAVAMSFVIVKKTAEDLEKIPDLFMVFSNLTQTTVGSYYLDSLAVMPEFRGRKFGRLMLEDTIEIARNRNDKKICLLAFDENKLAIGLYEKVGFKRISSLGVPDHPAMPYRGTVSLFSLNL